MSCQIVWFSTIPPQAVHPLLSNVSQYKGTAAATKNKELYSTITYASRFINFNQNHVEKKVYKTIRKREGILRPIWCLSAKGLFFLDSYCDWLHQIQSIIIITWGSVFHSISAQVDKIYCISCTLLQGRPEYKMQLCNLLISLVFLFLVMYFSWVFLIYVDLYNVGLQV